MKNILLVTTGGTIGSTIDNQTINVNNHSSLKLLQLFQQHSAEAGNINFKTVPAYNLLSENLIPEYWQKLIQLIEAENLQHFDGIIVTHGTDTLAFTASMLGLYFNYLDIPLLLVSSQYPLDHADANGLKHFICAVDYITQQQPAGVLVPYQNPGQVLELHIATRLASSLQLSSDFISVQSKAWIQYHQGRFIQQQDIDFSRGVNTHLKTDFSTRVLLIKPYPGLDYNFFNLESADVILHDLYHSGTACATDNASTDSLLWLLQQCHKKNIPVYLAPAVYQKNIYDSSRKIIQQGGKIIWNTSLETAYCKLLLAYGNFNDPQSIEHFLKQEIALEHISPVPV